MRKTLLGCGLFFFMTIVLAASFDKVVVFGDSLSDNGNLYEYMKHRLPPSPPYYRGRFSNGPVWAEQFVALYYPEDPSAHLLDYAFGGAGVLDPKEDDEGIIFTLKNEVDSYLLAHQDKVDSRHLFVIWIGANNYLAMPDDAEKATRIVTDGIIAGATRLVEKGATKIVVLNLPDLGKLPAARALNSVDVLHDYTQKHNDLLQQRVTEVAANYPNVQWLYVDANQWVNQALTNPSQYGFTNTTDTCFTATLSKPSAQSILNMASTLQEPMFITNPCEGYLFFDPVHPSTKAHKLVAEHLHSILPD